MRVAVIGTRSFVDYSLLEKTLDQIAITTLVSGGADGADKFAEKYAKQKGIPITVHRPDYKRYPGKTAPIMRNRIIINDCKFVVAFWDGVSRGTLHAITYANTVGKPTRIVNY